MQRKDSNLRPRVYGTRKLPLLYSAIFWGDLHSPEPKVKGNVMSFTLDTPKGDLNPTDSAVKSDDLDDLSIRVLTQKFFTETLCLKQYNANQSKTQYKIILLMDSNPLFSP